MSKVLVLSALLGYHTDGMQVSAQTLNRHAFSTSPTALFTAYNGSIRLTYEYTPDRDRSFALSLGKINGWTYANPDMLEESPSINSGGLIAFEYKSFQNETFLGVRTSAIYSDFVGEFLFLDRDPVRMDLSFVQGARLRKTIIGCHAIGGGNFEIGRLFFVQVLGGVGLSYRKLAYDIPESSGDPAMNWEGPSAIGDFLFKPYNGILPTVFFQARAGLHFGR